MQQSAAEKDRGRSGKIQIRYDFDVLLMTYDKFCVVRKSLQLRMEKNPVLFSTKRAACYTLQKAVKRRRRGWNLII